jgi:hypothetical protein
MNKLLLCSLISVSSSSKMNRQDRSQNDCPVPSVLKRIAIIISDLPRPSVIKGTSSYRLVVINVFLVTIVFFSWDYLNGLV